MHTITKTILLFIFCLLVEISVVPRGAVFASVVSGGIESMTAVNANPPPAQTPGGQTPVGTPPPTTQDGTPPPVATTPPPTQTTPPFSDYIGEPSSGQTFATLIDRMTGVLDSIVPFLIGLTVFIILWGIFTYIANAGNEEKLAEAKRFIMWGVVGVFCMLSLWGFVNLLLNSFALERVIQPGDIPKVPVVNPIGR
ncbi:MAG: hypothetical protein UY50_C0029G0009 [Parcubacteria group bacterium GW2011_GWA2_49_9]|nr:MAG: hypothetical protein UY50_C0029G0009 [Parcubacteria group bacterium GW2011_GWA2_49_9]